MTRFLCIALLLVPGVLMGQEARTKTQIVLIDGSVLNADISGVVFDVKTKYGVLKIPGSELAIANLGYNLTEDEAKRVKEAFNGLDSPKYKDRESAQYYLGQIGDRAFLLMPTEAEVSGKLEVKRRIETWWKEAQPSKDKLFDYFESEDGRVKGRIINKTIKVKQGILGELDIEVANIKTIANLITTHTTVVTDEEWKLVVTLPSGSKLRVTASGTVDLWPQTPGQYKATPKGSPQAGRGSSFMAGALIGKIDQNGPPFLIGEEKTIDQPGQLYLKIVENPWNGKSEGTYNVKIDRR
jgi:hypothetical protein